VLVLGEPVAGVSRHAGYMFQTDAVFPWKNVLDNVATGPIYRGMPREEARRRVSRVFGIANFSYANRGPHDFSELAAAIRRDLEPRLAQRRVILFFCPTRASSANQISIAAGSISLSRSSWSTTSGKLMRWPAPLFR